MLDVLRRIIQEVNDANDFLEAMRSVVQRVQEVVQTEACSIYLYNQEKQSYTLCAAKGFAQAQTFQLTIAKEEGLVGLVGQREEPINVESAPLHPNYSYHPETGEERFQAFLGTPIIHQRKLLGVLVIQQEKKRRFDKSEEAFLVTVSAQLASVIAHAEATGGFACLSTGSSVSPHERTIIGSPVSPGVSIGQAVLVYEQADLDAVPNKSAEDIEAELKKFHKALAAAKAELKGLAEGLAKNLAKEEVALFSAYSHMLDKTSLGGEVAEVISEGLWAQTALKKVIKKHVRHFSEMEDPYLKERAVDIKDLGRRVLKHLQKDTSRSIHYPENTILVGDEVTASLLAEVPVECLQGIVSAQGSKNSHVAVLARALGIPVVMGAEGLNFDTVGECELIVDGYNGRVYENPNAAVKEKFLRLIADDRALYAGLAELYDKPATTLDGHNIPLFINTGLLAEAASSLEVGAEGVGLYRTEISFLSRDSFPAEDEQCHFYREVLQSYYPRTVTLRTLDVGGDKQLPYFPVSEDNPVLGWRGIRITLDHPELFLVQVRAMLRASLGLDNLQILLPMITGVDEVRESCRFIKQAYKELREEGSKIAMPKIGAMIEVPSAAYQISRMASLLDFISVGTNDLIQYLLAVDRNNKRVAYLYDALHPSVIEMLQHIVREAKACKIPVAVCGEMASDPPAVILLLALGFDTISLNATSLLTVKWIVRSFTLEHAKLLLQEVQQMNTAKEVRKHLEIALDEAGLGGLIRAGK